MDSRTHRCSRCIHCNLSWDFHQSGLSNTRNASLVKDSCEPQQIQVDVAVRVFGPDVCRLGSAESCPQSCSGRLMTPAAGSRARGLNVRPYVSASAARWPVGPAALWRSSRPCSLRCAHGPACSSAAHGPVCGAARVSPKKPSRSRPVLVVRPGWPVIAVNDS
jgi:hypothetical protein